MSHTTYEHTISVCCHKGEKVGNIGFKTTRPGQHMRESGGTLVSKPITPLSVSHVRGGEILAFQTTMPTSVSHVRKWGILSKFNNAHSPVNMREQGEYWFSKQ
jgi:hypothetical protein